MRRSLLWGSIGVVGAAVMIYGWSCVGSIATERNEYISNNLNLERTYTIERTIENLPENEDFSTEFRLLSEEYATLMGFETVRSARRVVDEYDVNRVLSFIPIGLGTIALAWSSTRLLKSD